MTATTAIDTPSFATQLRLATRPEHADAEGSQFVEDLMAGKLVREDYIALLSQHFFIYSALEDAGRALSDDDVAGPFVLEPLLRLPSIESDLEVFLGGNWREAIAPLPATARYVDRLRDVAAHDASAYIAHCYTRYLGDLSGGQVIRRMLQTHYGLADNEVTFYEFTSIPKPKPFKDEFRALLDTANLGDEGRERVLRETSLAFTLNAEVFADLAARRA